MTDKEYKRLQANLGRCKDTTCVRTDCELFVSDSMSVESKGNHCRGLSVCENHGDNCAFYKKAN